MPKLTQQLVQTVLDHNCHVSMGDKLLVAVSGGADSMALLHILQQGGYQLAAAHCNFQLRGEASDSDEQLVSDFCTANGIRLFKTTFATREHASANKISIEMAARELRYNWFNELLQEHNFSLVVTGHHGNDSIETFFLNLVRGTGVKGLTGISYRNKYVVRPLLAFARKQIEHYCLEHAISWCHDASNDDTRFIRNKIRHEVIPVLESINPSFFETMQANMQHLTDAEYMLEQEVERFIQTDVVNEAGTIIIPISKLKGYPHYASLLFEVLRPYGFNPVVVGEVLQHLDSSSGKQFFSASNRLIKDRHNLLVMPIEDLGVQHFWVEEGMTTHDLPMEIRIYDKPADFTFSRNPRLMHFDADLVDLPLLVRRWKQGDVFMPLGMKGFKKISDFFIDEKYSLKDKEEAWLMVSSEQIVCVPGKRLDERFKVMKRTKRILEIKLL
ncbi:tRNA lysidine(34) synthetase TilS [Carboxylicivirga taeanensis]|uniref:tRNA lysidine(34) synthetase TilS n=1 Tax=Carboxylicivirga taeanensis TaxID=1416875 RepID=UPI003F6E1358